MRRKPKIHLEMKWEYAIGSDTIIIMPNFDDNGFLHSLLGKKESVSKVGLSPYDLIDVNLRFRGSSMIGALEGAQAILGKMNMNPLILDREREIILFPCKSPFREDCVWLALSHVKHYRHAGKSLTQVALSNGSTITLDVSKQTFEKKMQRAYELQGKMRSQRMQFDGKVMETGATYHLKKNNERRNYEDGMLEEKG
ncbi:competence protein ComK [Metaplanococcus flavidus]|uniref:Competence protein ComK n=1 Tax=Metaplanococcus flavidus TaxID=569883 RepID=A0ABW3LBP1_9BACL